MIKGIDRERSVACPANALSQLQPQEEFKLSTKDAQA